METYDFRQVSVTAMVPAFARGEYTKIPWAKEMLAILRARETALSHGPWSEQSARGYAPLFEARFLAVSRLLQEKRATQVLELAAGLSPRGIELAQRGVVYVEADLADSSAMKRELVTAILGSVPKNLHLCAASVIDREQLLACCSAFNAEQPVAVTTEGLLRYLTFEEKTQLATNVHEVLRRHGGWWITTDIHLRSFFQRQTAAYRENEKETLGRSLDSNYFADVDHARQFFEGCGFVVDSRPLIEGIHDQLTAPQDDPEITALLKQYTLFVMTPKL
jgi:O-methyltransferase involved in polyketide biosynthesis